MKLFSATVISLLATTAATWAQAPSLTPLGDIPGGTIRSIGYAISRDGLTIAGSSFSPSGEEAFRWVGGTMTALGDLSGGAFGSIAYGVANTGLVVGIGTSGSGFEGFRATPMTGLGDFSGGTFSSQARAISSDGLVIAGIGNSTTGTTAFRWQSNLLTALSDLSGGTVFSEAYGISDNGLVAVGRSSSALGTEACSWLGAVATPLGDLTGGTFGSQAIGANSDGTVIVGWGTSGSGQEATRWASGVPTGLGDLSGGAFSSIAYATNSDGSVVVGSGTGATATEAFIWTAGQGMKRLRDVLITELGVTGLANWSLLDARGISGDGRRIVGTGLNPTGNREAVLIQLPQRGGVSGVINQPEYAGSLAWATYTMEFLTPGTLTVVQTATFTLLSGRTFFVPTTLRGNYDVAIKGPIWLRKITSNVLVTDLGSRWLSVSLITGDIDDDNAVTPSDYGTWAMSNGAILGDVGFVRAADLDGDDAITPSDYGIWAINNGQVGQ